MIEFLVFSIFVVFVSYCLMKIVICLVEILGVYFLILSRRVSMKKTTAQLLCFVGACIGFGVGIINFINSDLANGTMFIVLSVIFINILPSIMEGK